MKNKVVTGIMLTLLFISMLTLAFNIQRADTSEPPATEWSRTYGGTSDDRAYCVVQTVDGGYALAGDTGRSAGNGDIWLVKTSWTGNMAWNKTYGGTSDDRAFSMVQTVDGGYALAGDTWSFGAGGSDFWLVKTDSAGNMAWNKTYGGTSDDRAFSMVQTVDGGYAVAGYASLGAGGFDFWLVKTDDNGNMLWNKTYGGTNNDIASSMVQTVDGGYAVAGYTESFGAGGYDFWLVKTDNAGNMEWNKTYGGTGWDITYSMVPTGDGGYAIAGHTLSFGAGGHDFWLVKTDNAGNMEWNKTYGGTGWEYAYSLVQTVDGGYAVAGYTESFGLGGDDFWLVKTDGAGNLQWNETYGGIADDWAYSIVQTSNGGWAMVGQTLSFGAGGFDFWLIKLAPEEIPATIDIDPDTLNLKSNGEWITAYVTLPEGYLVEDIDVASVELVHNDFVLAADWGEVQDGVLMVKFDRASLRDYLGEVDVNDGDKFYDVTLTVKGEVAGTPFEGSDTITVKRK